MITNIAGAIAAYQQSGDGAAVAKKKLDGVQQAGESGAFADTLNGFLGDAVSALKEGEQAAAAGAAGKANLQDVVLAVNNAEIMLQTVSAIREKVITAYQEVIRTAV